MLRWKKLSTLALAASLFFVSPFVAGCEDDAGDEVEEAIDDAGDAIEDVGDEIEDATDD